MPASRRCLFFALLVGCVATAGRGGAQTAPGSPPHLPPRVPIRLVFAAEDNQALVAAGGAEEALPLKPPREAPTDGRSRPRGPTASRAVTTVLTSLAVVLGLFTLLVWFARRANSKGYATLPGEVVQTLGRAPLNARQEMHLVRVGNKLLLLSVTATGAETLTEISDPEEIDRLAGICRQSHPDSITASFREVLSHYTSRT
jgi:flagellar biogenesis protein FliO